MMHRSSFLILLICLYLAPTYLCQQYQITACASGCLNDAAKSSNCAIDPATNYAVQNCACSKTGLVGSGLGGTNATTFLRMLNICLVEKACSTKDVGGIAAFHAVICGGTLGVKIDVNGQTGAGQTGTGQTGSGQAGNGVPQQGTDLSSILNGGLDLGQSQPIAQPDLVQPVITPSKTTNVVMIPAKTSAPATKKAGDISPTLQADPLYQLPSTVDDLPKSGFAPGTSVKDPLQPGKMVPIKNSSSRTRVVSSVFFVVFFVVLFVML